MYKDIDESQLAGKCREGDNRAADELYRRYAARLLTLCRRYSSSMEDAEDLMHDAMIKALDKMPEFNYQGEGSLYAWISKIAINQALNNIRSAKSQVVGYGQQLPDNVPDLPEEEMSIIQPEQLLEIISKLPDRRRAVFNLYCLDGYSHKEIGRMLGISEKGSASELAKARIQLKKMINDALGRHN